MTRLQKLTSSISFPTFCFKTFMDNIVTRSCQKYQVLWSVISSVSVYVMNLLKRFQFSTHDLFHNKSVFSHYFSRFIPHKYISFFCKHSFCFPSLLLTRVFPSKCSTTTSRASLVFMTSQKTFMTNNTFLTRVCLPSFSIYSLIPSIIFLFPFTLWFNHVGILSQERLYVNCK